MSKTDMYNVGNAASQILSDEALTLSASMTSASSTLSERVQTLFEQLHLPVFRYLMRKTKDSGQAEDMTQESFLRLFRHLKEERPVDNPKAWLFTVANNLAIDAIRRDGRLQDLDEATWDRIEDARASDDDPEKLTLQRERMERLRSAVLNLTDLERECLHLRAEGLRYREIADLMNVSMSCITAALHRATLKLSQAFENGASS
jgi:RNA polymerase sigma-70 factor, ECF subfamily